VPAEVAATIDDEQDNSPQSTVVPSFPLYHISNNSFSSLFIHLFAMPVQDRTNEFRACVESIRTRSSLPSRSDAKQRLLQSHGKSGGKSDFSRMAAGIGKDISSTNLKLGKLAQRMSY
jgi:hypothetical protein